MGELYSDFLDELEAYKKTYAGRPLDEIVCLLLIALEREQLVTVAYRDDLMAQRIAIMDVPDDARILIRQALKWAWKEEQMHTVYSRGILFELGGNWLRIKSLKIQVEGAIGGWAASIKNHVPFRDAPVARTVAGFFTFAGSVAGKVPDAIRDKLQYLSFHEYCAMQVDAELTAAAAWERMYELASELDEISDETTAAFHQMWQEEVRHRIVFEAIGDALDENDRMEPETLGALEDKIRDVGSFFLPRNLRDVGSDHPIGRGDDVIVSLNETKSDAMRTCTEFVDMAQLLTDRANALGKEIGELNVVVKCAFMLGYHRDDLSVLTDPELVALLADNLGELGVRSIKVGDGATLYDQFHSGRSVHEVAAYFGFEGAYDVIDFGDDQVDHDYCRGMAQSSISQTWKDADVRIFFAKLRSHPADFAHIALGTALGLRERFEQYIFIERQADRETAMFMPLTDFPPDVTFVDAYDSAADGIVGILCCDDPPSPRRVYAGRDILAVEMIAAKHIGLTTLDDSRFLKLADHWFGDSEGAEIVVHGCNDVIDGWRSPISSPWRSFLSRLAFPVWQLLGRRGALFLPPMDEVAFPMKRKPSVVFRAVRWCVRQIIGMRRPTPRPADDGVIE